MPLPRIIVFFMPKGNRKICFWNEICRKLSTFAGFSVAQVTRLRTEYEMDDGIPRYNVEFHEGDWEYEFEISATDGKILSYDKDYKFD